MASEFPIPERFRHEIWDLVHQLVIENYIGLAKDGRSGKYSAELLEKVIKQYQRTLIDLPDEAWECRNSEAYELDNQRWAIDISVWTKEDGYSDLTINLDGIEIKQDGGLLLSFRDMV